MTGWRQKANARIARTARFVVCHPWWVIAACLLAVVALASQLPNIRFDTSTEGFLHDDDAALIDYHAFRDQFGRDDLIVLALQPPRVFDLAFLTTLRELHERLEAEVPHLDEVTSLINARATRGSEDELLVEDLLEEWPGGPQDLASLEAWVTSNPSYRNLLISEDGRFTTLAIRISAYSSSEAEASEDFAAAFEDDVELGADEGEAVYLSDEEIGEVVSAVRAIVADFAAPDFPIAMAGSPVAMDVIKGNMRSDMLRFIRLTILAIAVLLFLVFRRASAVFVSLVVVILSLVSTIGLMAASGAALKLPTMVLPSFLLAVGVGDSVHILALFFRSLGSGFDKKEAIISALEHSGLPVILTSLTTAGGLLSFAPTELAPISDLGLFAPAGVMIALLLSLLLLPALLAVVPIRPAETAVGEGGEQRSWIDHVIGAAGDFATRRPWGMIAAWALLLCVAGLGAARIEFSHNPLEWLPASTPVRQATELIDRELRGSVSMEVVLTREAENGWHDPDALRELEDFSRYAEEYQAGEVFIGRAFSLVDVLKEIHKALNANDSRYYVVPSDRELIAQEFLLFENSGSDDLEDLVDSQFRRVRLTLKAPWLDAGTYTRVIRELESALRERFGSDTEIVMTGLLPLLTRTMDAVMIGIAQSYGIAFVVITLLMMLLIGSVRLGLVAMLPNLAPILCALGLMGWLGLPLDIFTMLIGSIALGLAVDDTIHFMHGYRSYLEKGCDSRTAIRRTLETAGRAMLLTTLVLSSGFLIFTLSSMNNIFNFGMLTAFAIAVALLADFLLAPALMQVIHGRGAAPDR
ncbi:MAG: MMPL family transporter [Deltaproteobacteria bacterium]|nr:MMPL family transporter [Deltaproteobacteria bacterium]